MEAWNVVKTFFTLLNDNWDLVTNGVIAVFTLVMAMATVCYAVISNRLYKISKEQIEASREQREALVKQTDAINELTKAVTNIPAKFREIELRKEISEREAKEREKIQRRATGGH